MGLILAEGVSKSSQQNFIRSDQNRREHLVIKGEIITGFFYAT